jgi:hypothetical protein
MFLARGVLSRVNNKIQGSGKISGTKEDLWERGHFVDPAYLDRRTKLPP